MDEKSFDKQTEEHFVTALWMFAAFFSLMLNINLIGALIGNGWNWIVRNWIPDTPSIILMSLFYVGIHCLLILGWKTAISNLK
jgi:hypothetical protein